MRAGDQATLVTLDGLPGTGKSTVARALSIRFGGTVVETGGEYRALGWLALTAGIEGDEPHELIGLLEQVTPGVLGLAELQSESVALRGARCARVPQVRQAVQRRQQARVAAAASQASWVFIVGRDSGSAFGDEAVLKIILEATPSVRARRIAGRSADFAPDQVGTRRDRYDGVTLSALDHDEGTWTIDTSGLSIAEVVETISARIERAVASSE